MTENQKAKLAAKAIRCYCQEHMGWSAKYQPADREAYDALMEIADRMEGKNGNIAVGYTGVSGDSVLMAVLEG